MVTTKKPAFHATPVLGSPEDPFYEHDLANSRGVKTISPDHKVYTSAPYAQELYDLICSQAGGQAGATKRTLPEEGDKVSGIVVYLTQKEMGLDIGGKDLVYIDLRAETAPLPPGSTPGNMVTAIVTSVDEKNYRVTASVSKMQAVLVREELDWHFNTGSSLQALVLSMNPGGYVIQVTFPAGQTTLFMPHMMAGVNKLSNAESMVGTETTVMLDSFSEDRGTYIASRKKYLETLIPAERSKLVTLDSIDPDDAPTVYTGVVTGATAFGVFVEFNGCLTGMVHKANINEAYAERIAEIPAGMEIDFFVKEITKGGRIILTQVLRESLWDVIRPKQVLNGKVRDVKHFGVLVKLDDETAGLVHTSELAKAGKSTADFKRAQEISVRVLAIVKGDRKIFLALA